MSIGLPLRGGVMGGGTDAAGSPLPGIARIVRRGKSSYVSFAVANPLRIGLMVTQAKTSMTRVEPYYSAVESTNPDFFGSETRYDWYWTWDLLEIQWKPSALPFCIEIFYRLGASYDGMDRSSFQTVGIALSI